jgi:phospholipid/cholesterol/gamma-HCH transport system ATP-binding protein
MQKRAALARAMALDPEILLFDEPSAGLDPISARRLDELIVHLKESLGTTLVIVTHDLDSILGIGTDAIFLDTEQKTIIARGHPKTLLEESQENTVREFLTRGQSLQAAVIGKNGVS